MSLSCTFQRAVVAALCGTDGGSCHFHRTVLAALCGAGVCLFLSFIKRCLFSDLCQTRDTRRYDIFLMHCTIYYILYQYVLCEQKLK